MKSTGLRTDKKAFQNDLDSSPQEEGKGKLMVFSMLRGKPNLISQVMNFENELAKYPKGEKDWNLIIL